MNAQVTRAELDAAKARKGVLLVDAHEALETAKYELLHAQERARHRVLAAEENLALCIRLTPADVIRTMAREKLEDEERSQLADRARRMEMAHHAAVRKARKHHKGLLPPEASSKLTLFMLFGSALGAVVFVYAAQYVFGWAGDLARGGMILLGLVVGAFFGAAFFDANFIIDESLGGPLFD